MTSPPPPRAGRAEWIGLGVLLLAVLLVAMDVTILYFAAPFISADLAPSGTQQLWMLDVYGFVLAGLLITMGSLADRTGRRRLLTIGAAAFGLASVGAAYAGSADQLIACRALMGVGGATLMPSSLALLRNLFQDPAQRRTAVAAWTAAVSGGSALGPLLGGLLLQHFHWGAVFLVNVPVMVALVIAAPLLLPESRDPRPGRFDPLSALLSLGATLPTVFGLQRLAVDGLAWLPAASLVAGVAVGIAFVRRQRGLAFPMIDLALFRDRRFSGALAVNLMAMLGLVGFALFTTQYLQSVLGFEPLTAALWTLPAPLSVGVVAPLAMIAARRVRPAAVVAASFVVAVAGFLVMTRVPVHHGLAVGLAGAVITTMGLASAMTLLTDLVLEAAPAARAGAASAVAETGQELGGALGVALLGSLGTAVYRHDVAGALPGGVPHAAHETLGGAIEVARGLPPRTAATLLEGARAAFTHGLHVAALGAGATMALAAAVAWFALRGVPPHGSGDAPAEREAPLVAVG
jgi:DHA2 family multidrug resistance protein-like MFS transporter